MTNKILIHSQIRLHLTFGGMCKLPLHRGGVRFCQRIRSSTKKFTQRTRCAKTMTLCGQAGQQKFIF